MSITNYVLGFAKLLETGALITSTLKKEDQNMHVIIAGMLRKSLSSEVMARVADDFHYAYTEISKKNQELQSKIEVIENKDNNIDEQINTA